MNGKIKEEKEAISRTMALDPAERKEGF